MPVLVFLSGAAALVHQICWIRIAALEFGSTLQATSLVLAIYFLGLGLGGALFGRGSLRALRPMLAVARVEFGIGALALLSIPGFALVDTAYDAGLRHFAPGSAAAGAWHALLVAAVVLPPALLMGGTLPLLCRAWVASRDEVGRSVAALYAWNTAGAAAGAALTGYVLIPGVGMTRAIAIGAAANLAAGALAWLRRGDATMPAEEEERAVEPDVHVAGRAFVRASVVLTGFAALGQEVLWSRFLALIVRNTVHTYTLTIAVVLAGLLVGSFAVSRLPARRRRPASWLATLQFAQAATVLFLMLQPAAFWLGLPNATLVHFLLLLAPSVLSGASFPLAVELLSDSPRSTGAGFGGAAALNTFGGIAGSLLTGFLLLPRFGLAFAIPALASASALAGWCAWRARPGSRGGFASAVALVAIPALAFAATRLSATRVPADYLANGAELVAYREGLQSNLAVLRRDGVRTLEIDRWWQGESRKTHQVMAAHLPMLLHGSPKHVLLVGVGAGQTPARFLMYPIERLDCVDIEPAVFDLIRPHFDSRWMDDPRTRLVSADGRSWLSHAPDRWDLISLEVGQMFRPGAAAFYSKEFYERARAHLEPGGVVSQFVPISFLTPGSFASILRTFHDVFPDATLWYNTSELLLVGSVGRQVGFDPARLTDACADSALAADLRWSYWGGAGDALDDPANLLGGFLCGPRGIEALSRDARTDHDDHPVLDYETADVRESDLRELPILALLRAHLDPLESALEPDAERVDFARAERTRERNLGDLAANASLRRVDGPRKAGEYGTVLGLVDAALAANPDNLVAARMRAETLLLLGRDEEAREGLRRVLAARPDDALAHRTLGMLHHRRREFTEAIALYRRSLAIDPDQVDTHNNLGAALAETGDLEGAAREFEAVLRLRPGDADATRNLGVLRASRVRPGAERGKQH